VRVNWSQRSTEHIANTAHTHTHTHTHTHNGWNVTSNNELRPNYSTTSSYLSYHLISSSFSLPPIFNYRSPNFLAVGGEVHQLQLPFLLACYLPGGCAVSSFLVMCATQLVAVFIVKFLLDFSSLCSFPTFCLPFVSVIPPCRSSIQFAPLGTVAQAF